MKTLLPTLLLFLLPNLAMAHGGHAAAGTFHLWLHLLYFLIPVILTGIVMFAFRSRRSRLKGSSRR